MTKPLSYLPDDACDLFERSISALMLELLVSGCPAADVDKAVDGLRDDFDRTREWLGVVERSAKRRNPFGCFKVVRFRRAIATKVL